VIKQAAAALLAGAAFLAGPAKADWVEARTDHFIVYGDMSEDEARSYAQRLERVDKLLRTATRTPDTAAERANRATIYFVPDMGTVQRLYGGGGGNVGGFFVPSAQGSYAVTPQRLRLEGYVQPQAILFHEYTHAMLLGSTTASFPSWIQEGFAEFFGTIQAKDDGSLVIGAPSKIRGFALMAQYQMTPEELLTADQRRLSSEETEHLYARGWLLVHMLMLKKERAGQLDQYLKLVAQGVPSLEAGKQAFGDLDKLNRDLNVYTRSAKFQGLEIPASKLAVGQIAVRTMRPCEAKIMPIRLRSAVGVNEKTAPSVAAAARKAAAGCENEPFVQRTLAETEFDAKNNAEAMAAADHALALDPKSVMAMVYKGRVYARNKDWANARKWFVKANREDPNYALPLVLYYDSFGRAGERPSKAAVDGLLRAIVLVPQDRQLRIRVVRGLLTQGDLKSARAALEPLAFAPHSEPDAPPKRILKLIDDGKDAKIVLAEMDKAKWNEVGNE